MYRRHTQQHIHVHALKSCEMRDYKHTFTLQTINHFTPCVCAPDKYAGSFNAV